MNQFKILNDRLGDGTFGVAILVERLVRDKKVKRFDLNFLRLIIKNLWSSKFVGQRSRRKRSRLIKRLKY